MEESSCQGGIGIHVSKPTNWENVSVIAGDECMTWEFLRDETEHIRLVYIMQKLTNHVRKYVFILKATGNH